MKILIIRHAKAEEREGWSEKSSDDSKRPLTEEGRVRMFKQAKGLKQAYSRIDVLLSSPFVRAAETAEILRQVFQIESYEEHRELRPGGNLQTLIEGLNSYPSTSTLAVVGHEPELSELLALLLLDSRQCLTRLKKGSACLVEFDASVEKGAGELRFLLSPRVLRSLSELS